MKLPERGSPFMQLNVRSAIATLGAVLCLAGLFCLFIFVLSPMMSSDSPPLRALAIGIGIFALFSLFLGQIIIWLKWTANISCPKCGDPVFGKVPGVPERKNNFYAGFIPFVPSKQIECDHCGFDLRYASVSDWEASQKIDQAGSV